jgi:NADH:ubiquinone oxidoreductase subunit H
MGFALFFLAEYGSIILMSVFTVIMFLGGWLSVSLFFLIDPFILGFKTSFILFFFYMSTRVISEISCWSIDAFMLKNFFTVIISIRITNFKLSFLV